MAARGLPPDDHAQADAGSPCCCLLPGQSQVRRVTSRVSVGSAGACCCLARGPAGTAQRASMYCTAGQNRDISEGGWSLASAGHQTVPEKGWSGLGQNQSRSCANSSPDARFWCSPSLSDSFSAVGVNPCLRPHSCAGNRFPRGTKVSPSNASVPGNRWAEAKTSERSGLGRRRSFARGGGYLV